MGKKKQGQFPHPAAMACQNVGRGNWTPVECVQRGENSFSIALPDWWCDEFEVNFSYDARHHVVSWRIFCASLGREVDSQVMPVDRQAPRRGDQSLWREVKFSSILFDCGARVIYPRHWKIVENGRLTRAHNGANLGRR